MSGVIKILAEIEVVVAEGGRKTPFYTGYRPLFNFENASTKISGSIRIINKEKLSQGMHDIVEISFIKGVLNESYFKVGTNFTFDEGWDLVGKGKIVGSNGIINSDN